MEFEIYVPVIKHDQILEGKLRIRLDVALVETNKAGGREDLKLELYVDDELFKSCGKHGWFDDELQEIQALLPDGIYIKSCYTCAFSDYHPAGYGAFGCLACFRNNKQEYLSVKNKIELMNIFNKNAESVQETYLCPEYEKRVPGTGYRG